MKYILTLLILTSFSVCFAEDVIFTRSRGFDPEPFSQEKFDYYLDHDRAILLKFTDKSIPELNNFIVRIAVNKYGVVEMQGKGLKVPGDPIVGIFHKDATVLIYEGKIND
ncbi:MAG: hypothetical protein ACFFG0_08210 [Candidatus Thorarchaeota archaeon]